MLKKTITYEDFNGDMVTEDFYFHLSKAELVELEMSHEGGLSTALERIIAAKDNKALITEFKSLLLLSYGKRSDDGKRFVKTQELRDEFTSTEAYSVLFMELVTETDKAIDFVQGVIPKDLGEEAAKVTNLEAVPAVAVRVVTPEEMEKMSAEELQEIGPKIQSGEIRLGKSGPQE